MDSISSELLEKVRKFGTRVISESFDEEIKMLIAACRKDLLLTGIKEEKVIDEKDPLVLDAIFNYVRAEFGLDNEDYQKYRDSYISLRNKMFFSTEYCEKENE